MDGSLSLSLSLSWPLLSVIAEFVVHNVHKNLFHCHCGIGLFCKVEDFLITNSNFLWHQALHFGMD